MKNVFLAILMVGLFFGAPSAIVAVEGPDTGDYKVIGEDGETKTYPIRLEEAKKQFEVTVDETKKDLIGGSCVVAQEKIAGVITRTQEFKQKHSTTHEAWKTRLANLSARLKTAGVATTTLDGYLQQLNDLISANSGDFEQYLSGLEDVSGLDCEQDPQGFYEELQDAKAARALVISDLKEVVSFIKENIKTELLVIKAELEGGR